LVVAGILSKFFGQIIPKLRELRDGVSPPLQDIRDLSGWVVGDMDARDRFLRRWKNTFPMRYYNKMKRVANARDRGWLVYDEDGSLLFLSDPMEQIAWLLGVVSERSGERRALWEEIREERIRRADAYEKVYKLLWQGKVEEAKRVIAVNGLDVDRVVKEMQMRLVLPKQLRSIQKLPKVVRMRLLEQWLRREMK